MKQPTLTGLLEPEMHALPTPKKAGHVRETSVEIAQALESSGYLDARMKWVLEDLRRCRGPVTAAEIAEWAGIGPNHQDWDRHLLNVRRGLSELRSKGVVENCEPRDCRITHRKSLVWRIRQR